MPEQSANANMGLSERENLRVPTTRLLWRWAGYAAVALACAMVFALYVRPDMMVTLADQLWACF
jgi:hypothetical protein